MTDFTMATDADGVATISWEVAAKSMNVMSTAVFDVPPQPRPRSTRAARG